MSRRPEPQEVLVRSVHDLPADYDERVYAGVLGKIIGVYLGRPFEGWTYDRILRDLGEITGYVNDRVDLPLNNHLLVVTDDDISGTLVFPRVLDDVAIDRGRWIRVRSARTWLNELIPDRTVLWWGGLGNSTEHTAYLRLRAGVEAPLSGSAAAERSGGVRAGRCADLLRGVRDDLSRGSGRGGRPGAGGRQRES